MDAATSDTAGFVGIAQTTQSAGASVDVVLRGQSSCVFDGSTTAGDYVQASTTTAGDCHDAGSTRPTSGQIVGRVLSTNGSAGTYTIEAFGLESVGAESTLTFNSPLSRSTNTISCSNCEQTGNKNAASGYAGLDSGSKLSASQLPNPSSSTLGGIQSFAALSNKWINAISTSGVPSATQPAASDLSNGTTGSGAVVLATAIPTPSGATVATSEATSSTTYTDLTTSGPAVTVTVSSTKALVTVTTRLSGGNGGATCFMGFAVSGSTTVAAADEQTVMSTGTSAIQESATYLVTGLTAGSNTFTAKYKAGSNTCTFLNRNIIVTPH